MAPPGGDVKREPWHVGLRPEQRAVVEAYLSAGRALDRAFAAGRVGKKGADARLRLAWAQLHATWASVLSARLRARANDATAGGGYRVLG